MQVPGVMWSRGRRQNTQAVRVEVLSPYWGLGHIVMLEAADEVQSPRSLNPEDIAQLFSACLLCAGAWNVRLFCTSKTEPCVSWNLTVPSPPSPNVNSRSPHLSRHM